MKRFGSKIPDLIAQLLRTPHDWSANPFIVPPHVSRFKVFPFSGSSISKFLFCKNSRYYGADLQSLFTVVGKTKREVKQLN